MGADDRIARAAAELIAARQSGTRIEQLSAEVMPQTLVEAYAVQNAIVASSDRAVVGWKVGATSAEVQKLFGVTMPVYGPVFSGSVHASPANVTVSPTSHRLIESEFTFRFSRSLSPRATPYSRAEILACVDALMPSFEIIDPRFPRLTVDNIPQLVADCVANGGTVLGAPNLAWRSLDLETVSVSLRIDGTERQRGTGSLVLGNPLNVLDWFANALRGAGRGIEAGQFVMTGTATGVHAVPTGATATARFDGLGDVSLRFA